MKKLFLAVLLLMGMTSAMAQQVYNSSGKTNYKKKEKKGYDPDRLVLGGNLNFGLGSGYASLGVSPIVGYRLAKTIYAGVGLGYHYLQGPDVDPYKNIVMAFKNIVYPSAWARAYVYRNVYALGVYEYDIVNKKSSAMDANGGFSLINENTTNSCFFVGAGMKQPISGRLSLCPELMYDLIQGKNSPYTPGAFRFRMGIVVGM